MPQDKSAYREVVAEYERLLPFCIERRFLRHGDFGSNNVLVADGQVVGIIDWDNAAIGDYLMDVAGAHFWSEHLVCMKKQAAFYDAKLAPIEPNYHERLRCYQLMIGLDELNQQQSEEGHRIIESRLADLMMLS